MKICNDMNESNLQKVYQRLNMVSVFEGVLHTPLLRTFFAYAEKQTKIEKLRAYASFAAEIYRNGGSLVSLVSRLVFEDENVYIKARAKGEILPACIGQAVEKELQTFSLFAALTAEDFALDLGLCSEEKESLPTYQTAAISLSQSYEMRVNGVGRYGYGVFSSYPMFRIEGEKQIVPIKSADKTEMSKFIGYELERGKVEENTRAFLAGKPAANVLLCGDAGTGKSSTVKALVNAYYAQGLRLIELRKDQLFMLPSVMGKIAENPLKFILFIDDLSFNKNDDNFSMLKAALEGSASARADNAIIYATSNRRHIVKENFADREGGDVHRNDTLQETLSLSERFGLTVLFSKPDKKLYLAIVRGLALRHGIEVNEDLEIRAEAFALRKGNRSARCAEQFIDSLL
ncbi:MAG: ATP-binding protein [Clostridia bacterium]|nr:ATP-binding protein [Clostridia bacterium]